MEVTNKYTRVERHPRWENLVPRHVFKAKKHLHFALQSAGDQRWMFGTALATVAANIKKIKELENH